MIPQRHLWGLQQIWDLPTSGYFARRLSQLRMALPAAGWTTGWGARADSTPFRDSTSLVLFDSKESRHQSLQDSAAIKSHLTRGSSIWLAFNAAISSGYWCLAAGPQQGHWRWRERGKKTCWGVVASQILQELRHGSEWLYSAVVWMPSGEDIQVRRVLPTGWREPGTDAAQTRCVRSVCAGAHVNIDRKTALRLSSRAGRAPPRRSHLCTANLFRESIFSFLLWPNLVHAICLQSIGAVYLMSL